MSDSKLHPDRPPTMSPGAAPRAWFSERTNILACGAIILCLTMLRYWWFGGPQSWWDLADDIIPVGCGVWLLWIGRVRDPSDAC